MPLPTPHAAAVKACTTANANQPAAFITAIEDGRGGSLVWLTDADANLWLCSADSEGHVYANTVMTGDLLQGAGAYLVDIDQVTDDGAVPPPELNPINVAERACEAYLSGGPGKVIGSGKDGLEGDWVPGYYVFIETSEGNRYLRRHGRCPGLGLRRDR